MARSREHELRDDRDDELPRSAPESVTEEIATLLAGYSLNALSEEETEYIDRHLPARPEWRAELQSYQRVAGALAYSSPPHQVPVRARAAILARIDAIAMESQAEALARNNPPAQVRHPLKRWRNHGPRVAWAAAVPTTMIAIVFVMTSILMQDRISDQQAELAAFQQEQSKANDVLLADGSEQQVVELIQTSNAPLARGRLFIDRNANTAMLMVRDMPPPGDDSVYSVWLLIGSNHDEHAKLGTLALDEFGRGQMILDPPDDFDHYPLVRITLEGSDESEGPTGPEIMTGGIERSNTP